MQLMTTFCGNKQNFTDLKMLLEEYNLQDKRLVEFTELDKMIYQNIKFFVKMI